MKEKLNAAIEVLIDQLQTQLEEVRETKKMINALRKRMGEEPMFSDIEESGTAVTRPDLFYGKPLATAVQEYLEIRKRACTAEEILAGLEQGGFDFRALEWKEKDRLRSLAISLAKNTKAFHKLPNNSFGLISWYDQAILKRSEKASNDGTISSDAKKTGGLNQKEIKSEINSAGDKSSATNRGPVSSTRT